MEKIVNLWRGKEVIQSTEKEAIIKELKQQKTLELTLSPKSFSKIKKEKYEEGTVIKDESSKILPLVKKFEKPNINEEKNETAKITLKKVKQKIEEGKITSSSSTFSRANNPVVSSGPGFFNILGKVLRTSTKFFKIIGRILYLCIYLPAKNDRNFKDFPIFSFSSI